MLLRIELEKLAHRQAVLTTDAVKRLTRLHHVNAWLRLCNSWRLDIDRVRLALGDQERLPLTNAPLTALVEPVNLLLRDSVALGDRVDRLLLLDHMPQRSLSHKRCGD